MLQEHMENREWLMPHDSGIQFGDFGDLSALTLSTPHLPNVDQLSPRTLLLSGNV